jgi:hypothetical protein
MLFYKEKFKYLYMRQNGLCPIAKEHGHGATPDALHHRLHNTKENRERFILFIDSILNLVAVNNEWHINNNSWGKITEKEAEKWERFLIRHHKLAIWVNTLQVPDKLYCANCANCIVKVMKNHTDKYRYAVCKQDRWEPILLHDIKYKYKYYCPGYKPMGNNIEEYMKDINGYTIKTSEIK